MTESRSDTETMDRVRRNIAKDIIRKPRWPINPIVAVKSLIEPSTGSIDPAGGFYSIRTARAVRKK